MNAPAYVFFDLDGVLIDSEPHHAHAEHVIYQDISRGMLSGPAYNTTGTSTQMVYEALRKALCLNLDTDALVRRHFEETFCSIKAAQEPAMPGLIALLDTLDGAGIPYAVVSSSMRSYVVQVLSYLGIFRRFRFLVCGDEVENVKPAPDPYRKALLLADVQKEQAIAIEDSHAGVLAANSAGIRSIGFDRQVGQDLSDANMTIGALADVIGLFSLSSKR